MDLQKQESGAVVRDIAIPCVIGFVIFVIFCGPAILNPQNLKWILAQPDPTQHYVGWTFFRHSPYLQWPLGLNRGYGEAIGSSIVFSDSIPLFALLFKLWRIFLPTDFQYFGIWIALCFTLQSVFAWKILSRYTADTALRALGCIILCLSPVMLWRLHGHEALVGHWLLLAGLYLYLRDQRSVRNWLLLVAAAALIHAYLLAMVGAFWAASFVQHYFARHASPSKAIAETAAMLFVVALTTTAAGYFVVGNAAIGGFGYFRMNIASLFNTEGIWSIFRTSPPWTNGDYEGFCYPGAGVLALALVTVVLVMRKRGAIDLNWRANASLVVLCILFYVYALSNRIAFGSHEVFQYTPPRLFDRAFGAFRASGRFIWPVIYSVEVLLLFAVLRLCTRKTALCILGFAALLQTADLVKASRFFHERWSHDWSTALVSEFWKDVPKHYRHIAFVMPFDMPDSYGPVALLAANNGMTINGGYLARVDTKKLADVQSELTERINTGSYRSDTLYIFGKDTDWDTARQHFSGGGLVGVVDSYRVIAPGWISCNSSCGVRSQIADIPMENASASAPYLKQGWSSSEGSGRWTDGTAAQVSMQLPPGGYKSIHVAVNLFAFVNAQHPYQHVTVRSGSSTIASWTFSDANRTTRQFDVPVTGPGSGAKSLQFEFELPDAKSPRSLGLSDDARQLGIYVHSMEVSAN